MSTRIVFDGGGEVTVAQEETDVIHAVRRDHPNPVTLESSTGSRRELPARTTGEDYRL